MVDPLVFSYPSYDGLPIEAMLFEAKPENSNGHLILWPHGGPQWAERKGFRASGLLKKEKPLAIKSSSWAAVMAATWLYCYMDGIVNISKRLLIFSVLQIYSVTYLDGMTKPMLVIQGANDPRVVKAESDNRKLSCDERLVRQPRPLAQLYSPFH